MYRAILCDDNEIIAQGLSGAMPWSSLGIEFGGCCYDGLAAKELLDQEMADILISDVRMPFMDGLELTRYAREKNPDIRVIIISGYDDFRYAQEAIKLGAMDYLLKPVDPEELAGLLKRAVQECRQREEQKALASKDEQNRQGEQMRCLIYDGPKVFEARYGSGPFQKVSRTASVVLVAAIDNFDQLKLRLSAEEQQEINRDFFRCMEKYAPELCVFERRYGSAAGYILGNGRDRDLVRRKLEDCMGLVRRAFRKICPDVTITFGISRVRRNAGELQRSYTEAMLALQERFVYPPGSDIFYEQVDTGRDVTTEEFDKLVTVSELVERIRQGDRTGARRQLDELKRQLQDLGGRSYLFMKLFVGNIFTSIFEDLQQFGIEKEDLDIDVMGEYQQITEMQSVEQAMDRLYQYAVRVMELIESNSCSSNVKTVMKACRYIEEHYMEQTLNMDDVAGHIHMSPSYFSVIFKRETGVSFTDYLIRLRIRKSQELMQNTDLKIYEISARVGYDTAAYYSTAFRKETGVSPTEYKKSISRKTQGDRKEAESGKEE